MKRILIVGIAVLLPFFANAQSEITIDGNFDDWMDVETTVTDSANDEHDTDWYSDGLMEPVARKYSDVDILEVKFTHDQYNLYGYAKATGAIGRTSSKADGQKAGRYYYIITIDVDNNDTTGYPIEQGNYWPNSVGYDMNMEVEFYDGSFNTGHYIHHGFLTDAALTDGRTDLENHIIRVAPGNYDDYLQWVVFPDTSFVYVSDKGPVIEGGIIEVAVSEDGHEAEMKAPMWGFFWDEFGEPIVQLGDTIDISFSLEGSGELSESAIEAGYTTGNKSVWGSDTADPIVGYYLKDIWTTSIESNIQSKPASFTLEQNYPNPFNSQTQIQYTLEYDAHVQLDILNVKGQRVTQLVNSYQRAGGHRAAFKNDGTILSSGMYLVVLRVGDQQQVRRMLYLK